MLWFATGGALLLLLAVQTLLGRFVVETSPDKFEDKASEAWSWFLPNMVPVFSLMVSVFVADLQAAKKLQNERRLKEIDPFYFWLVYGLSVLYLVALALSLLVQPFVAAAPLELMRLSNFWLGPLQGLVTAALGMFFVNPKAK